MRTVLLLSGALLMMFSVACSAAVKPDESAPVAVDAIVAKIVAAYGGRDAVKKVERVYAEGQVKNPRSGKQGVALRYFSRPRLLRIELGYGLTDSEIRILNGSKGWIGPQPFAMRPADALPMQGMLYQYQYLDLPMSLVDASVTVTHAGRHRHKGTDAEKLIIKAKGAPDLTILVDPVNGAIMRAGSPMSVMGMTSELAAEFSDFRKVNGVLFPHRIENYSDDTKIGEITIYRLVVNGDFGDAVFDLPR